MAERYQVVIVGGGPVGVGLAVDLGLRGVSCVVVEKRTALSSIPKGQGLSQRTLEHCWFWGVADEIRAARVMPADHAIGQVTTYRDLTSDFWHAPPARELVAPYYFQTNERLPQYRTEEVLRNRAWPTLPGVDSLWGWAATEVEQDDDGVRVTVEQDGERARPRGRLRGRLRRRALAGARAGRHRAPRHRLRRAGRARRLPLQGAARVPGALPRPLDLPRHAPRPAGLLDVLRPGRRRRGVLLPRPRAAGARRSTRSTSPGCCTARPASSSSARVDHVGFWDLRVQVATPLPRRAGLHRRRRRAHPPALRRLRAQQRPRGRGQPRLEAGRRRCRAGAATRCSESYGLERQPIFRDVGEDIIGGWIRDDRAFLERYSPEIDREEFARQFEEQTKGFGRRLRDFEPHYEGSPVVLGPPGAVSSAHGEHTFEARVGHHLPPQQLSTGRNVFEELGDGFTLLAFDADDAAVEAFAAGRRGPGRAAHRRPGHAAPTGAPPTAIGWSSSARTSTSPGPGTSAPEDVDAVLRQVTGRG